MRREVTRRDEVEALARRKQVGLARELYGFIRENKKWWLAPIVICILGLGGLVFLAGSGAAPFIYTLF